MLQFLIEQLSDELAPASQQRLARTMVSVDWEALRRAAAEVAARAYAPYSGLKVGAAGLSSGGFVLTGCNVENASYGLTLCAECGLVSALAAAGDASGDKLVAVSIMAADGDPLAPCGRCRQLLLEHGGPELLVDGGVGTPPRRIGDLLPLAFDTTELEARRQPGSD
jgi:cytidine deaminase